MNPITVQIFVTADIATCFKIFTTPAHIEHWMHASEDWECSKAENNLTVGGHFSFILNAKDHSVSFDFNGDYTQVIENKEIAYTIEGGRKVTVSFTEQDGGTLITETFDPENENSEEMQRSGWQAMLTSFKLYTETLETL